MIVVMMMGRTAAGKTTLAQYLAEALDARYVPEAALKRVLVPEYATSDSLDEGLRDLGYAAAAAIARECVLRGDAVVVDAAFHRKSRRDQFLASTRLPGRELVVIYCRSNDEVVRERISLRRQCRRNAYTQADSYSIYEHVNSTFNELDLSELTRERPYLLVHYDSSRNTYELRGCESNEFAAPIVTQLDRFAQAMSLSKSQEAVS